MLRDVSMFTSQVHFSSLPPEPVIPSKKPFRVELLGGKRYSWCTCGHSKKQVELPLTSSCIKTLWPTHPVYCHCCIFLFSSRSATELTNSKPKACSRSASSRTKTPQFGCAAASTQTTLHTVTAHTNRTSSCLLLCTNPKSLEKKAGCTLNWRLMSLQICVRWFCNRWRLIHWEVSTDRGVNEKMFSFLALSRRSSGKTTWLDEMRMYSLNFYLAIMGRVAIL